MKRVFAVIVVVLTSLMEIQAQDYQHFGTNFKVVSPMPASELSQSNASGDVQVKGEVESVCQAAGCWMKVKLEDGKTMRVTFKDYGFFVPKNLAGSKVIFRGVPKVTTTSVEDLKHYAVDAGKSKKEIDAIKEPKTELTFVADGVLVPFSR